MHSRRLAALLTGVWLAAGVAVDFTAIQNFRSVDRFLNEPSARTAEQIRDMGGRGDVRVLLRASAAEQNRFYFEQWEYAQFLLGVAVLATFVFGHGDVSPVSLGLTGAMLVIVGIQRFWLTGEITRLGRLLDYPNTPGADPKTFWQLHGLYSGLDLLKLALGLALACSLVIRFRDRGRFAREHARLTQERPGAAVSSRG